MENYLFQHVYSSTGQIEATIAVDANGNVGVAVKNVNDRQVDKEFARDLAMSRAANGESTAVHPRLIKLRGFEHRMHIISAIKIAHATLRRRFKNYFKNEHQMQDVPVYEKELQY